MKFATREDIAAPIEAVFQAVSDFDGFERAALRRRAEITRTDSLTVPGPGMSWRAQFEFRNRQRDADLELREYDPPNGLKLFSVVGGLEVLVVVDLLSLSRGRTRMNLSLDMRPTTIPARLMLQSMKLARSSLAKRFHTRVADFAKHIEERYNRRAG